MSNSTPAASVPATRTPSKTPAASTPNLNEDTSHGTTTVNDGVVSKIAGIAAREVSGVHDLGGGAARAIGALRNRINQGDHSQGISVEVGEKQAAVDVKVVADYPVALHRIADDIRSAVTDAIENLVGLEVTEVNVEITDVFIPSADSSDDDDSKSSRVQ